MLKQIWIAECDLCGRTEECNEGKGFYNDSFHTNYTLPDGWCHGHNKDFLVCPECLSVRERTNGHA